MITPAQLDLWGRHLKAKLVKLKHEGSGERLIHFCKLLKTRRIEKNKDAILGITGEKGEGKSTLAIHIGMLLRMEGMTFDDAHIVHGKEDFKRGIKLMTTTRGGVFIFDEIIKFAFTGDVMKGSTKYLIKLFTLARKKNHIVILNIPVFKRLVGGIRDDHVNFWIHIWRSSQSKERKDWFAEADLIKKNKNPRSIDPWGLNDTKLSRKKITTGWEVHEELAGLSGRDSPTVYVCTFTYPPLPEVIENEYIKQSDDAMEEFGEEFIESLGPKEPKKPHKQEAVA